VVTALVARVRAHAAITEKQLETARVSARLTRTPRTPVNTSTVFTTRRKKRIHQTAFWRTLSASETSYHAIRGRPALAKFMAVSHYVYLVLKMSGSSGVLSLKGDLKCSYDCDTEAVELASTTQVPNAMAKIFTSSKKLVPSELKIPTQADATTQSTSSEEVKIKAIDLGTGDSSKTTMIGARDGNGAIPVGDHKNVLLPERAESPRPRPRPRSWGKKSPRPRPRVGIRPPTGISTPKNPRHPQLLKRGKGIVIEKNDKSIVPVASAELVAPAGRSSRRCVSRYPGGARRTGEEARRARPGGARGAASCREWVVVGGGKEQLTALEASSEQRRPHAWPRPHARGGDRSSQSRLGSPWPWELGLGILFCTWVSVLTWAWASVLHGLLAHA
jgi:hypothetical protein